MSGVPRLSPRFKPYGRTAARFGLTFEENAFVVAFCGKGRYNVARAAELIGMSESDALNLYGVKRIRQAIDSRLRSRTMSGPAIEAELSDLATADAIKGGDRVKALELLVKVKGIGRDRALVLLERFMLQEVESRRERSRLAGNGEARRLGEGNSPSIIDVSPVRAETALAEGGEVQAQARERETLRRSVNPAPTGVPLTVETQLALPLVEPAPLQDVEPAHSAVSSPKPTLPSR